MKLFGFPVVLSDEFPKDSDKPFVLTFGNLNDYLIPLTAEQVENILAKREIEIPAERLEILNYI